MTTFVPPIATGMNSSTDAKVLQSLGMQGVSLALWQRSLPEDLVQSLDALPAERLPRLRQCLYPAHIADAVRDACHIAGTGACSEQLACEIEEIATHAMQVFSSPLLGVRLDVIERRSCPKWHLDAVLGRMLCTLRGAGTEYGPIGPDGEPQSIHHMPRGAVGVFRGALWPGPELAAILHRSPQASVEEPRLLLVIDPVDDAGTC
ncbi:MAG: DUF1826 domain-containing protein [Mangrovicoccus sp.]